MARLLGVSNSAVSNWENGFNSIDIETLFQACRIFGVTLDDMYGTHEKKPFYTPHTSKKSLRNIETAHGCRRRWISF